MTHGTAVIFDVDGVLLDLTPAEEDGFFLAFERRYGLTSLSRDWDSYRTRNDEDIIDEILESHGLPLHDRSGVIGDYLAIMQHWLEIGYFTPVEIPGTRQLLEDLQGTHSLGIATANLRAAAKLRLAALSLWSPIEKFAFGADGGGPKRDVLARAIASIGLPRERIVFIGDNISDVDAGLANGVHFIGFSTSAARREKLEKAGAKWLSGDHAETRRMIETLLV